MNICQRCSSERVMSISAKCSDQFEAQMGELEYDGDVPRDLGLGAGDYVRFSACCECGQIQGDYPLPLTEMEETPDDSDDDYNDRDDW